MVIIAVTGMEDRTLICTIAIEYEMNDIPTDREIKTELYRRSQQFEKMVGYSSHEWGTLSTKKSRKGIVYGVRVEYRKI